MTFAKKSGYAFAIVSLAFALLLTAPSQTAWALGLENASGPEANVEQAESNAGVSAAASDSSNANSANAFEDGSETGVLDEVSDGVSAIEEPACGQATYHDSAQSQEGAQDATSHGCKGDASETPFGEAVAIEGESSSETPTLEGEQLGVPDKDAADSKPTMARASLSVMEGASSQAEDVTLENVSPASVTEANNVAAIETTSSPSAATPEAALASTRKMAAAPVKTTAKGTSATHVAAKAQNDPPVPAAHVLYRTHVQNDGWQNYKKDGAMSGTQGRALRLEGINIYLTDANGKKISGSKGGIQYQVHVQNIGWQDVKANDVMAGTTGMSYRLEAIRIMLTGELSQYYDIVYRTHVQNDGWQGWKKNGAMSGTEGKGYRLEGIEVKLERKASKLSTGTDGIVGVRYRGHVQNVGWQAYVIDGDIAGTSGRSLRVEALNIALDKGVYSGGIEYQSHVQNVGWQSWKNNGAMTGTSGKSLRVEALRIRLTGDIAKSYDVIYRAHVENVGWQNWSVNGTAAGTTGKGLRVEAVQVKLVKKGTSQPISEGTYFFSSAADPTVSAEDPGVATGAGTQMRGYITNYTNAQRFYVRNEGGGTYSIQSVASGLFLADSGGKVVQVADSSAAKNRWKASWNGGYSLVNVATGKEISFSTGTVKSGTVLSTKTPAQTSAQRWTLTNTTLLAEGTYTIKNAQSGNVLDVNGASWDDGANVMICKANGGGNQAFTLESISGNTYLITCAMTGKAVDVNGGSKANGANVQQCSVNGSKAQQWNASIGRNGKITFTNRASGKAMTAAGSSSGANVVSSNANGGLSQWTLAETSYKPDPVLQRALNKANASSSSTSYYIAVDLTNHRTIILQGRKGSWRPVKNWTCSTGASSSPTVLGDYTITGYHMYSFGHGYTCYYATQFWGDYLFHSVLYNEGTHTIQDGRLGKSISAGCVRLQIDNAKWIYNNIPAGTHVKTYY